MSKRTNLDIKDTAYLHIVHNLQHPTFRPTTKSTKATMDNAPTKNISPYLAGRYGKSTKRSPQWRYPANEDKSGLEAERILALGACKAWDSERSLRQRNNEKRTSQAMKRNRNGLRMMLRKEPLWQGSVLKMQRRRFNTNRMIWCMLNSAIDSHRGWKNFSGDASCYRRQSEWSSKFRRWGGWGRWGGWRDWAGQVERRWRTQLGDGHNHQNSPSAHGEVSAEEDEDRRIDLTRMGGCSRPLPWMRKEVRYHWIVGFSHRWAANKWGCSGTFTDTIWRADGECWHCPRNIPMAARDFSTRM